MIRRRPLPFCEQVHGHKEKGESKSFLTHRVNPNSSACLDFIQTYLFAYFKYNITKNKDQTPDIFCLFSILHVLTFSSCHPAHQWLMKWTQLSE